MRRCAPCWPAPWTATISIPVVAMTPSGETDESMNLPAYFEYGCGVQIVAGHDALEQIPDLLKRLGALRPLVVSDKGVAGAGLVDILGSTGDKNVQGEVVQKLDEYGNDVFLKDIWPSQKEIADVVASSVNREEFTRVYHDVFKGENRWTSLESPVGQRFGWSDDSTYIRNPPYFEGMSREPDGVADIHGARVLALLGDSVTTDHISPAGAIKPESPAGQYLLAKGVQPADFNSLGSRRGNHEVMMRGTFANIRLRNLLAPGTEGGVTVHQPTGQQMSIYDAAMRYRDEAVPLIVIAGKEYGSGSSRDWAAKGPRLLGVRAVIAESYERIHRTNLVCMGILPLQFNAGETAQSLGLTGRKVFNVEGLGDGSAREVRVRARAEDGSETTFQARVRIDTPQEIEYYRHGGILHYVLRQLAA